MRKFIRIITFLSFLFLNGCSVYKGKFDCAPGKGIGCESVSQVNDLVNNDTLDDFIDEVDSSKKRGCLFCSKKKQKLSNESLKGEKAPGDDGEKLQIYFNEYKDTDGVLYKPSEIEMEIKQ